MEDPRRAHTPRPFRDDGPLPQHYPDLATGEWIACIIDWTPEGEMIRIEGARFGDYLEAWEGSRRMARERREARSEEAHHGAIDPWKPCSRTRPPCSPRPPR